MMLSPLLLRADASHAIGLGHVMRLLAMAQAFIDRGGRVHFAFSELPGTMQERFVSEGVTLHRIPAPPGSLNDAKTTGMIANSLGAHWVVIDGYQFTAEYQQNVKATGVSLAVIDDLAKGTFYDADIVVNQNICAESYNYTCGPSTSLLLGPQYMLLRREFLALRRDHRSVSNTVRRILVTFGGSDPSNTTALAIKALGVMPHLAETIDVVVGGANPRRKELQHLADRMTNQIRLLYDVNDMSDLMAQTDLALSAASTTALELAYAGVPSILCATADNQEAALHAFRSQNIALSIGPAQFLTMDTIQRAVADLVNDYKLRRALASRAKSLVDGYGALRILEAMFPQGQGSPTVT